MQCAHRRYGGLQRRCVRLQIAGHEQRRGARVGQDVLHFPWVQLGVDRHHGEAGEPRAVQHLEVFGTVGHEEGDALAALQAGTLAHRRGNPRGALGQSTVIADQPLTVKYRRRRGMDARGTQQELGKIHR